MSARIDEIQNNIVTLYKEGFSRTAISNKVGLNLAIVSFLLKDAGFDFREQTTTISSTKQRDKEIRAMFLIEKMTVEQIAEAYKLQTQTIINRLKAMGVLLKKQSITDNWDLEEVKQMYFKEGMTLEEIGSYLGSSSTTVRTFLLKNGITCKKSGGRYVQTI